MTDVVAVLLLCATGVLFGLALRAVAAVAGRWRRGLERPHEGRVFAGVCAAVASRSRWSVHQIRLLFVGSIVLPGSQVLMYLLLWALLPSASHGANVVSAPR